MADDMTELVTVQYPPTQETREVPRGGLPGFLNQGFVVLDKNGHVSASATSAAKKESN